MKLELLLEVVSLRDALNCYLLKNSILVEQDRNYFLTLTIAYSNQNRTYNMAKYVSLILTRFLFLFCILFVLCFNNGAFPFLYYIQKFSIPALQSFIPWFAQKYLSLSYQITTFTNGSGDTTYDYVLLLCVFLVSFFGTIIWSALDRDRKSHDQLFYWTIVVCRFYVGFMLVHYGIAKLNDGQFPSLYLSQLTTTYGDSSPMGLAWRFLGFSDGYKWFMFTAEMMGVLLFFRKTATIGAFLCLMTSANIMAINYFYDVPVKLLSTALVLMCLIILSPNIRILFKFFFKGELVRLNLLKAPVFKAKWARISKIVLKYAAVLLYAAIPLFTALNIALISKKTNNKPVVYGAYDIEEIKSEKNEPLPDTSFLSRKLELVAFDRNDYAVIKYNGTETAWCTYKVLQTSKTLDISFTDNPKVTYKLNYQFPDSNKLILKGNLFGTPATITLKRKKYQLAERPFRWISEHPYNR
ncbi:hypothetical protein [Pedobacter panaciterrae]